MLQNGWLDAAIPMNYKAQTNNASLFNSYCDRTYSCWRFNRHVYVGLGAYLNSKADVLAQLQYVFTGQAGGGGFNGAVTFSYGVPNTAVDGGDWWSYAAASIYPSAVSTPSMPWRNPATATEGMMWGRVQDAKSGQYVDDATVTVLGGPSVKTDGNGYYVATMIPATAAGTVHSTTASKTGMAPQTKPSAKVLAGDVVRYDFYLNVPRITVGLTDTNTVIVSWPYPTPGWNLQYTAPGETNWSAVGGTVSNDGLNNSVIVDPGLGDRVYRLSKP
jgi:hypothetical protein